MSNRLKVYKFLVFQVYACPTREVRRTRVEVIAHMYELLLSVHVLDKAGKTLQLVSVMTYGGARQLSAHG